MVERNLQNHDISRRARATLRGVKSSTVSAGARKPAFFWQALLILLPVGVLAAVGLYSLRQDRLLAEHDAKELAGGIALRMAQTVAGTEMVQHLRDYRNANFTLHANRTTDLGLSQGGGSKPEDAAWNQLIRAWQQANPGLDLSALPVADCAC